MSGHVACLPLATSQMIATTTATAVCVVSYRRYTHKCGHNTCEYVLPAIATINTKHQEPAIPQLCVSVSCVLLLLHLPDKSCHSDQLYPSLYPCLYLCTNCSIQAVYLCIFVRTLLCQLPKFTQFQATPYQHISAKSLRSFQSQLRIAVVVVVVLCDFMGGLFIKRSWRQFDIVVITINGKFLLFRRCRVSKTCATIIPKV